MRNAHLRNYEVEDRGSHLGNCWVWQGYLNRNGSPTVKDPATRLNVGVRVELFEQKFGSGAVGSRNGVRAACGEGRCVNPDHAYSTKLPVEDWIRLRTTREGDCLVWPGAMTPAGPVAAYNGKARVMRRVAWAAANGGVSESECIATVCGNRRCLNAEHMAVVQRAEINSRPQPKGPDSPQFIHDRIVVAQITGDSPCHLLKKGLSSLERQRLLGPAPDENVWVPACGVASCVAPAHQEARTERGAVKVNRTKKMDLGYETACEIVCTPAWLNGGYAWDGTTCAHRSAWLKAGRSIERGHHLHHKCRNPRCVRLDHLEVLDPLSHKRADREISQRWPRIREKRCATCGETRSRDHFLRDWNQADGHLAECNLCILPPLLLSLGTRPTRMPHSEFIAYWQGREAAREAVAA